MRIPKRLLGMALASTIAIGGAIITAEPASALSSTLQVTANVNIRPFASTSNPPIGSLTKGQFKTFECIVHGENINGNRYWARLYHSPKGFVSAAYIKTPDGRSIEKYLPLCGRQTQQPTFTAYVWNATIYAQANRQYPLFTSSGEVWKFECYSHTVMTMWGKRDVGGFIEQSKIGSGKVSLKDLGLPKCP